MQISASAKGKTSLAKHYTINDQIPRREHNQQFTVVSSCLGHHQNIHKTLTFLRQNRKKAAVKVKNVSYVTLIRYGLEYIFTLFGIRTKEKTYVDAVKLVQSGAARCIKNDCTRGQFHSEQNTPSSATSLCYPLFQRGHFRQSQPRYFQNKTQIT